MIECAGWCFQRVETMPPDWATVTETLRGSPVTYRYCPECYGRYKEQADA